MASVLHEQADRIVTITINRPEAMNAVDPDTHQALIEAWTRFRDDDSAWVAILTGAGEKAFCAGADLKKMIPVAFGKDGVKRGHNDYGLGGITRGIEIWKPMIAAINLILGGTVGITLLVWWFERSKLGLEAQAVRDNERAAEAIGVNALGTRLRVTAASAALTAAGGTFCGQFALYVDPGSFLSPQLFIQVIIFTAVGGMGTLWGPIVGAL